MKSYSLVVAITSLALATVAFLILGAFSWLSVSAAAAIALMAGGSALYLRSQPVPTPSESHLLYNRERV